MVGVATNLGIIGIKLFLITVDVKVGCINFKPIVASSLLAYVIWLDNVLTHKGTATVGETAFATELVCQDLII